MLRKLKHNSLLSGTGVYLASNILNALIPFVLLPILTRYLTQEEYGQVAMFQTLAGALMAFVGLSLNGAASRKFFDGHLGENELREFIGASLQILLVSTTITLTVLGLLGGYFSQWLGLTPEWILLAVLMTASKMIFQIRLGQWQVRKQAKKYGTMQVSQSLLDLFLSLALVIAFSQGVSGRISAEVCAMGIFALLGIVLLKKDGLLKFKVWRPQYISEALSFGVPLIPHVGGAFLLVSVDRFVINAELGLAQTGVYMVAVQFGAAVALVFDSVNKAYVPWLFERLKRGDDTEKRQIVRYTYGWYVLILCGAGLAFLVGPAIVTFVVGEQYAGAGEIIGWMVLGRVFGGMYLMVTNYIFFSKRTGLLSLVTILSGLINVVLLFLLVKQFGLYGAAYAFCIAMALRFLFTWMVAQKRHPMPWFEINSLFPRTKV